MCLAPFAACDHDTDHVDQSGYQTSERIEKPPLPPRACLRGRYRARAREMVLDPSLDLANQVCIDDLDQSLEIGQGQRLQIEAADKKTASINGRNLGVQDRFVPFVDHNACRQQLTIETPGGRPGERHIATVSEQQVDLDPTVRSSRDGADDASVRQKVAMGDVNTVTCHGERFQVAPP